VPLSEKEDGHQPGSRHSVLLAQKEENTRARHADGVHGCGIGDEIGNNHERQSAEYRFPKMHSFTVDKGYETDGAEYEPANQIRSTKVKHAAKVGHAD
jgi:hypothetical protein